MESDPELHEAVDDAFRRQNGVMLVTVSGNAVSKPAVLSKPAALAPTMAVAKPAPTLALQFLSVANQHLFCSCRCFVLNSVALS
jgi:hypothetical protein